MVRLSRRHVLQSSGVLAVGALAGCSVITRGAGTESPDTAPDDSSSLTEWERSTDCEQEPSQMHDSVIKVARVTSDLDSEYIPIHFANLSTEEQAILRTVTEDGGYGTCDPSDAFHRFVDRVFDRTQRQTDNSEVYLERDGTFYGLYVEVSDEVYAY